jgi:hypothetical protein
MCHKFLYECLCVLFIYEGYAMMTIPEPPKEPTLDAEPPPEPPPPPVLVIPEVDARFGLELEFPPFPPPPAPPGPIVVPAPPPPPPATQ